MSEEVKKTTEGQNTIEEPELEGLDLESISLPEMDEETLAKLISGEGELGAGEPEKPGGGEGEPLDGKTKTPTLEEMSERLAKLEEENTKLGKQVGDKESFIQRQAQTVGDLRRQLETTLAMTSRGVPRDQDPEQVEKTREEVLQDPVGFLERVLAERENTQTLRRSMLQHGVREVVPDVDELKDAIAELALEDGFPKEQVDAFRATGAAQPQLIKGLAARVKIARENTALREEVANLKKRLEEMPKALLKKIDAAAKKKANITQVPGGGDKGYGEPDASQLPELSDADLDELIKRGLKA